MVTGHFAVIRTADADDAAMLKALYDSPCPRACLLDPRYELSAPTLDEVREALAQKEVGKALFSAVEDKEGTVHGFCALRGLNPEVGYSELVMLFLDNADFETPSAEEVMNHLVGEALQRFRVNKVMTRCLDTENEYGTFLRNHAFRHDGTQREVLYTGGQWRDMECYTLFRADTPYGGVARPIEENL